MGQYYMPLVEDRDGIIKTFYSHEFDNGLKLMEHSWIGNNFVNAVLSQINRRPARLAWVGDYSYEYCGDVYEKLPLNEFLEYYQKAWDEKDTYKVSPADVVPLDFDENSTGFFINHTQKVYIDVTKYIKENTCRSKDWDGFCVHPLPLLTACGNGRGGGDYNYHAKCGIEYVGSWAFDEIEYSNECPAGYMEDEFEFREWE